MNKKGVAILESTNDYGKKAVEIISQYPEDFDVQVLSSTSDADLLIEQAILLKPNMVVLVEEENYMKVKDVLWEHDIHVYGGSDALKQVLDTREIQLVFSALEGSEQLPFLLDAIYAKKDLALCDHAVISQHGAELTQEAFEFGVNIYPATGTASGIFQSMVGDFNNAIYKVYIPCTDPSKKAFAEEEQKAIQYLFNLKEQHTEIILHPENAIQAIVQFEDGSMKAHISPGIEQGIAFALTYPERKVLSTGFEITKFEKLSLAQF